MSIQETSEPIREDGEVLVATFPDLNDDDFGRVSCSFDDDILLDRYKGGPRFFKTVITDQLI
jgi:hypothetical protein